MIGQRVPPNCHCKDRGLRTESMDISSVIQEDKQIDPGSRATLGWFHDHHHHHGFLNNVMVRKRRDTHDDEPIFFRERASSIVGRAVILKRSGPNIACTRCLPFTGSSVQSFIIWSNSAASPLAYSRRPGVIAAIMPPHHLLSPLLQEQLSLGEEARARRRLHDCSHSIGYIMLSHM